MRKFDIQEWQTMTRNIQKISKQTPKSAYAIYEWSVSHYSETLHTTQLASRIHRMRRKKAAKTGSNSNGSGGSGSSDDLKMNR